MRSVRLDEALEARLAEAARVTGQPVSGVIRDAVAQWCDALLGQRLDRRLADVIGVVHSEGGRAEKSGRAFAKVLLDQRRAARE